MTENNSNIWVRAYFPNGQQIGITIGFDGIENLPDAESLQRDILSKGFLLEIAGVEAGEFMETMTHVSRRMHTNKKDGSITPVIAFYHENTALNFKFDHVYMNTPEQIAEFEAVADMKITDIPELESDMFLDRTSAKAAKFIVPLKTPIKVAAAMKPYKANGSTGETKKIQRFLSAPVSEAKEPEQAKNPETNTPDNVTQLVHWSKDKIELEYAKMDFERMVQMYGEEKANAAKANLKAPKYATVSEYLGAIEAQLKSLPATGTDGIPF